MHVTCSDILYATVMMAQFAKNLLQENWPGIKRILKFGDIWKELLILYSPAEGREGTGNQNLLSPELEETINHSVAGNWETCCVNRHMWPTPKVICTTTSSLIEHTLPTTTLTTGLYMNYLYNTISYLDLYDGHLWSSKSSKVQFTTGCIPVTVVTTTDICQ